MCVKTQSPETVQGRQPVWSRGRRRGVFAGVGGDTPLLPQLGSSLLQARPGMTGPYVSHTDFSEGGWEGAGLRAPRRGH